MSLDGLNAGPTVGASSDFPVEEAQGATSVVFLRTDGIGDGLLSTALLEPLARRYPHWGIHVVCPEYVQEVFEHSPWVASVIPFDLHHYRENREGFRELNDRVARIKADLVLNTVRSRYPHTDRLAMAAGAGTRIAISDETAHMSPERRSAADMHYTHIYRPIPETWPEKAVYKGFLNWMGAESSNLAPRMRVSPDDEAWAKAFVATQGIDPSRLIILMAGALHDVRYYRHYGPAIREAAIDGGTVIALGSARDAAISQANLDSCGYPAINLCGKTTLGQCAALMSQARLAVGAETGLAHFACAVSLPQALLMGGGHFGRFMPYSPLTTFAALPLDCFGCGWHCRHVEAHCVKALPYGLLARAIEHAWGKGRDQQQPMGFVASKASVEALNTRAAWANIQRWADAPCAWTEVP
jgi:ADP-heptose:LPS heptosyltransferase